MVLSLKKKNRGRAGRGEARELLLSALVGMLLVVVTGCAVGPDYVRPKAEVPAAFKEREGWKVAQPKDEIVRGAWWEIFGDSQLNELEGQILISNQNIAAAEAQFRQARALVQASRAAYFPQVTANPAVRRSLKSENIGGAGPAPSTSPVSDFLLPLDVSWEMDIWGRIGRSVEASRGSAQASAADLESARLSAEAELAQDYFQLRALDAQQQLLESTVVAYRKYLELTNNLYTAGVVSKADVFQAETQLKTAEAQRIDIGVQRAQLEHAMALLVGKPASSFSIPVSPLLAPPPPIPIGMPSELLERRPDIAAAERRMAAANARIGVAEAAFYPTVTLGASGGLEASHFSDWLSWPSHFWSIGSSLAGTVFDGGSRQAQSEYARAAYDATVASYRQAVLTGFQEVEDNLAALRILEKEAGVQEEAVQAAEQSLAVTTNRYKAGIVSYLNVVISQTIALNNQRSAISILGRRMTAGVLLIKAVGGGWNSADLPSIDFVSENGHPVRPD
jgi:NodT family efflux transporter outer membrane factor (OMF) lipoprotein